MTERSVCGKRGETAAPRHEWSDEQQDEYATYGDDLKDLISGDESIGERIHHRHAPDTGQHERDAAGNGIAARRRLHNVSRRLRS